MAVSLVDALVCDVKMANPVNGVGWCSLSAVMKPLCPFCVHLPPLLPLDPCVEVPIEPNLLVQAAGGITKRCYPDLNTRIARLRFDDIAPSCQCDDQRPCSRCIARSEECVHVGRGPKLVKLRCEGCREDNKRCEDPRPCKYCVESNKPCVLVPRKGRGHGTRVKAVSSIWSVNFWSDFLSTINLRHAQTAGIYLLFLHLDTLIYLHNALFFIKTR